MSIPNRLLLVVAVTLGWACPVAAQGVVWVVDDDGGPGVDFTDIGAAVTAAADLDTILVKSGSYAGFTVEAKALHVVGDVGADVRITGSVLLLSQTSADATLFRNLEVQSEQPLANSLFDVRTSLAPVWIEDCDAQRGVVTASESVAWIRCTVETDRPISGLNSSDSQVIVLDTTANGGRGADGFVDAKLMVPQPGSDGPGAYASGGNDVVFLGGSSFLGGDGGDGLEPDPPHGCTDGGDGGPGLSSRPSLFGADSQVFVLDSSFAPGGAGSGGAGCADGTPGLAMAITPPGAPVVTSLPGAARGLEVNSPVREGETISITFTGEPGDSAFLWWAVAQEHQIVPGLRGTFLLQNSVPFPGAFAIPSGGSVTIPATVPELGPGFESVVLYLGSGFVASDSFKFFGSSSALVLLDDGF